MVRSFKKISGALRTPEERRRFSGISLGYAFEDRPQVVG